MFAGLPDHIWPLHLKDLPTTLCSICKFSKDRRLSHTDFTIEEDAYLIFDSHIEHDS